MSFDQRPPLDMKFELESILQQDNRFGGLHRLEIAEDGELVLKWDNAVLRQKKKSNPGPYLAFMEKIADCLADFGYCLTAEEGANEQNLNNYLLILPDDEHELED